MVSAESQSLTRRLADINEDRNHYKALSEIEKARRIKAEAERDALASDLTRLGYKAGTSPDAA